MVPLSSGDELLEIWLPDGGWKPFFEAFLTEAAEYKLRYEAEGIDLRIQGMPLPFHPDGDFLSAVFLAPFQSGRLEVSLNGRDYETFIYPDSRKLTEQQFDLMIEEILEVSNTCFQLTGLEREVSASGRSRGASWTQWMYIERSFRQLRRIFTRIEQQPFSSLIKLPISQRREQVQRVEPKTIHWLDKKGYGEQVPLHVETEKTFETMDMYENRVLKKQLTDLSVLLRSYMEVERTEVAGTAANYHAILRNWLNASFLKEVSVHRGAYAITQKFRKQPVYRQWYQWFEQLYRHDREGIGFDYPIALKDTFTLYEMWCFMKIVGVLRELDLVVDTRELYGTTESGLFLDLAENKESRIELRGGMSLYFQRNYQYNSGKFHTFTQRMIPDIVLEYEDEIIIFDPKYRVPGNLGTALGEMHKYRDGILHRETGERAVREVFILTPTHAESAESMRYFQAAFHDRYKMGAIPMVPGDECRQLRERLLKMMQGMVHV
ncbi:DUF2357 domain-containing protein [Lysinibacillus sphaericus]